MLINHCDVAISRHSECLFAVIPAKAGIPKLLKPMDSRLRGNDSEEEMLH